MRVGVLGGTFDPIHYGHLVLAEEARACLQLCGVILVPARESPHKIGEPHVSARHRLQMVRLAVASNPAFSVSEVDVARPGPSYTVDTLAILQEQLGAEAELFFLMGTDSLAALLTWHRPDLLLARAQLAVAARPGYQLAVQALERALPGISQRTHLLQPPALDIASQDLRRRVRAGLPIKYQVPEGVEAYIREHALYRGGDPDGTADCAACHG
jgi:nicotinate-nucleotide adenylyltransferase